MRKKKKYYKVLTSDMKSVVSYFKDVRAADLDVQYVLDQWVTPKWKYSRLFVFNSIENVRYFISSNSNHVCCQPRIFEVEVKNPRKNGLFIMWVQDALVTFKMSLNNKRDKKRARRKKLFLEKPPKGTVFVSAVKLIKEVY